MVPFGKLADTPEQLVDLLHQSAEERTIFVREQGEQFLESDVFGPAHGPCQLTLVSFSSVTGLLNGAALRFNRGNGTQNGTGIATSHCFLLRLQQREHLA